ncbi:MAG TPA: FAD-binding oxidoreductase [Phycisphaeraceae bacterium]
MSESPHARRLLIARDEAELVQAARDALSSGVPLMDYGVAHRGLGHPPPAEHQPVALTANRIEHEPRDMVVRVEAGCTMARLQAVLGEAGQFLPLEADDDLTIGEVVLHNVYGPLRAGFGAARDLLGGLSFVDGEGQLIHVGGQTVKNVAGYDLTRLMVGSLGELGFLSRLTLRTSAIPPYTLAVDLVLEDPAELDKRLTRWLATDASPAWMTLSLEQGRFAARLGYLGSSTACHAQLHSLKTLVDEAPAMHLAHVAAYDFATGWGLRAAHRAWQRDVAALVKVVVPPARTGEACRRLAQPPMGQASRRIEALPLHGRIFVGGELDADEARQLDQEISPLISELGGLRVWHRRPRGAESIEPFAPPQPDRPLLCRLKDAMDPRRIFNPGRCLPGAFSGA